jgi:hypothetical protein
MASFDYPCDWRAGFIMDPNKNQRVGYLVDFQGLNMGEFLKQDVDVFTPYSNSETAYGGVTIDRERGKATVVGVIEHFSWAGGVGDPVIVSAYISAENAQVLQAKMKGTLDTNTIKKLSWWICDFDAETKVWYEAAYPKDPASLQGQLNASGSEVKLMVASEATRVAPNVQVNVYNMMFEVIPAANSTFALHFATSGKTNFVKNWGLKVGTNAAQALPAG